MPLRQLVSIYYRSAEPVEARLADKRPSTSSGLQFKLRRSVLENASP